MRDATQGGAAMSSAVSTHRRLQLTDSDSHQLATLIANMIEDHLRATALTRQLPNQEADNDQQDHDATLAEDSLRLHSSVEHGTSPAPS
jgi:hypothetical protein